MTAYEAGRTGGSHAEGIEVMIRAALQSPNFLFRLETTTPPSGRAARAPESIRARHAPVVLAVGVGTRRRPARRRGARPALDQRAGSDQSLGNADRTRRRAWRSRIS